MNKREKFLIIVLAAAVILLGGFKLLIEPKLKKVNQATTNYNQASDKERQITDTKLKSASIKAGNEKLRQLVLESAKSFFPEIENDKIHIFFNRLADNAGVKFDSLTMANKVITQIAVPKGQGGQQSYPAKDAVDNLKLIEKGITPENQEQNSSGKPKSGSGDKQPEDLVEMMTVSVQFVGAYDQGLAFVNQINGSGRLVRISSLNVSVDDNGIITFSITAECFGISKLTQDELSKNTMPAPSGKSNPFV